MGGKRPADETMDPSVAEENLVESIAGVLANEIEVYAKLRDAIVQERVALKEGSVEALLQTNAAKETVLLQVRMIDEVRRGLMSRLARRLQREEIPESMESVLAFAAPERRADLRRQEEEIRRLRGEIAALNGQNMDLIHASMTYLNRWMEFIARVGADGIGYLASGRLQEAALQGRVLSRKG